MKIRTRGVSYATGRLYHHAAAPTAARPAGLAGHPRPPGLPPGSRTAPVPGGQHHPKKRADGHRRPGFRWPGSHRPAVPGGIAGMSGPELLRGRAGL